MKVFSEIPLAVSLGLHLELLLSTRTSGLASISFHHPETSRNIPLTSAFLPAIAQKLIKELFQLGLKSLSPTSTHTLSRSCIYRLQIFFTGTSCIRAHTDLSTAESRVPLLEQHELLLVTIGVLLARAKLHLVHQAAKSRQWYI